MSCSPQSSQGETTASISTRFNLDQWDMQDSDTLLLSTDEVFFYVHRSTLLELSSNFFGGLLTKDDAQECMEAEIDISQPMNETIFSLSPKLVVVDISSDVLNIILLALYHLPMQSYYPTQATLRAVIPNLLALGYNPEVIAFPHSELYGLLLKAGAADPLPMYALAAQYGFEHLAVAVSALTLKTSLSEITEDLAQQMGPVYLRRLFFLHLGRADALKRIILPQPALHPMDANPKCNAESQKAIIRAWMLTSAYVIAQNHPGIGDAMEQLSGQVECSDCRRSLQERISRVVHDWSTVKCTI